MLTHISRARPPTSAATRSFISPAALLVKVIAMISPGCTSRAASRYAIRLVSTRVLPEPAPATISSGVPKWVTAARCGSLRPSSSRSGIVPGPGGARGSRGRHRGQVEEGMHGSAESMPADRQLTVVTGPARATGDAPGCRQFFN